MDGESGLPMMIDSLDMFWFLLLKSDCRSFKDYRTSYRAFDGCTHLGSEWFVSKVDLCPLCCTIVVSCTEFCTEILHMIIV